ncbi:hypothetical protein ABZ511_07105 [Nocardia gamkensis]|uniref:hypothetical protein n=1 Tax=Nocardia gamkensis TaxID=352869 RepID=UPI003411CEDF
MTLGQRTGKPSLVGRRGNFYQFTAIDDCTRLRIPKIYPRNNQKTAILFLDYVLSQLPFAVETIQTDNRGGVPVRVALASSSQRSDLRGEPRSLIDRAFGV